MKAARIDRFPCGATIRFVPLTLLLALWTAVVAEAQSRSYSISIVNRDGTGLRDLLTAENQGLPDEGSFIGVNCPRWSPDGQRIAFDALTPAHNFQVMVVDVLGGEVSALGPGLRPDWSPDGKHIAFKGFQAGGAWIMNADGSGREEFIHGGVTEPKYSPDGRGFLYSRDRPGHPVYYFEFSTGTSRRIDTTPPLSSQHISWSPDGRWIVGVNSDYLSKGYEPLFVSMDSTKHRTVTVSLPGENHMCMSYAWSPDGKTILCSMMTVKPYGSQMYSFDVPDLNQQSVTIRPAWFEGQDPHRRNSQPAWSPDGKQIVFFSFDPREQED